MAIQSVKILKTKNVEGNDYFLLHLNPAKKSESFEIREGESVFPFFRTIRMKNAFEYFDAIGTNKTVTL